MPWAYASAKEELEAYKVDANSAIDTFGNGTTYGGVVDAYYKYTEGDSKPGSANYGLDDVNAWLEAGKAEILAAVLVEAKNAAKYYCDEKVADLRANDDEAHASAVETAYDAFVDPENTDFPGKATYPCSTFEEVIVWLNACKAKMDKAAAN